MTTWSEAEIRDVTFRGAGTGAVPARDATLTLRRPRGAIGDVAQLHARLLDQHVKPLAEALPELVALRELQTKHAELSRSLTLAEATAEQIAIDKRRAPLELPAASLPGRLTELRQQGDDAERQVTDLRAALATVNTAVQEAQVKARAALERLPVQAWTAIKADVEARDQKARATLLKKIGPQLAELEELDRTRQYFLRSEAITTNILRTYLGDGPQAPRPRPTDLVMARPEPAGASA